MENRKLVKLISVLLTLAFLPAFVFAYSPESTHNALTDEMVDFYNYSYPSKKLDDIQRVLLKRGSIEEDAPSIRVVNHFYDPIRNVGLKSINNTSKAWAMNAGLQSNNDQTAGTGGLLLDTFTSPADFSWERAIFDYVYKDKERGLFALGHILHLIEDVTVPDHVRDDAHPPAFDFGSPYEAYTSRYTENTIETFSQLVRERVRPVELDSIGEYFDTVATFTNTNFFSKDTIFDEKYVQPVIGYEERENGDDGSSYIFGYSDAGGRHRLVRIVRTRDTQSGELNNLYYLTDSKDLILSDYWSILSRIAVKNGTGIIKLFFDEVEKEKQNKVLLAKNKSMWSKLIDNANTAIKSVFSISATSTSSNNLASVVSIPSGATTQIVTFQTPSSQTPTPPPNLITTVPTQPSQTKTPTPQTNPPIPSTQIIPTPPTTIPPLFAISPGFGGGSTIPPIPVTNSLVATNDSPSVTTFSTTDATSTISYFAILSPQSNSQIAATSAVIFSGTSTPSSVIGLDLALATTTTDTSGNWQLSLTLSQGTTTLIFYSADPTNARATSTVSISVYLDNTAPIFAFTVPLCAQSLASDGCVVATTTIPISLSSMAGDFNYFTLAIDGVYSTTTTAPTTALLNDSLHTIEISATDLLGNQSATSTQTLFTSTFPVIINEVAWAGSQASTTAEWIELYNKTPYTISLSGWTLYAESLRPYISLTGTIPPRDFYLLERRDDTAVNTVSADQVYGNGGSSWALSNTGDRLILSYASTTIDQTALTFETNDAGFWAGGENQSVTKKISMERFDSSIAGDDEFNWDNNLEIVKNGRDVAGHAVYGTPKARNSLSYLINKNQDLEGDMTLTLANSPYLVVDTFLDIPEGHTLTVEPGVVVKFREGGFDFGGRLISRGTQGQPVIFTSFADDAYGGDLNGDATSTLPTYSDWSGISFSASATGSIIDGLKLFHSGGLYADGANLSGTYVEISDAEDALYVNNAALSLTHSLFQNNGNQVLQFYNSTASLTNFTLVGTTTTSEALDAYGNSHINIDGFSVTEIPAGDGFVVYSDSSLTLRNGVMTSFGSTAVDVFVRSNVDIDAVIFDASDSFGSDIITLYNNSHATTTHITIRNSVGVALSVYGRSDQYTTLYIATSTLISNTYGIYLSRASSARIESTEIFGGQYGMISYNSLPVVTGLSISSTTEKAILNLTPERVVIAENNWWGNATGPQHPILNSGGLGDIVSDGVDFEPWLTFNLFNP